MGTVDLRLIDQLAEAARRPKELDFGSKVNELIGPVLNQLLVRYSPSASPTLRAITILEFGNLLKSLSSESRLLLASDFERILLEIVEAADWKIRAYQQPLDTIWDESRRRDVLMWLDSLAAGKEATYLKPLLAKLDQTDRLNIADRTLRAIVHCTIKKVGIRGGETLFRLHQGRVCLNGATVYHYLIDQIGLYIFLFLDRQAGDFLTEACIKVKLYVRPYLLGKGLADINVICNDIVGQVREEFLLKIHRARESPFFLDSLLSTYLIGFVTQENLIWKAINGQLSSNILPDDLSELTQEDNNHQLRDILRACKRKLNEDCREIIDKRYDDYYLREVPAHVIAEDMDKGVKSVEGLIRRCMEKLKNFVVAECQLQRLNFSPR